MDLILWRHADAEDGKPDLERKLTAKGRRQAARVAEWLLARLPAEFSVISSPAVRARQTAEALNVPVKTLKQLAPGASIAAIAEAAGWPRARRTMIVVGHQPDLGRAAAYLLSGKAAEWHIEKGALWWLVGEIPVVIRAVTSPELL
jgi:phosphohistidine phosphatase